MSSESLCTRRAHARRVHAGRDARGRASSARRSASEIANRCSCRSPTRPFAARASHWAQFARECGAAAAERGPRTSCGCVPRRRLRRGAYVTQEARVGSTQSAGRRFPSELSARLGGKLPSLVRVVGTAGVDRVGSAHSGATHTPVETLGGSLQRRAVTFPHLPPLVPQRSGRGGAVQSDGSRGLPPRQSARASAATRVGTIRKGGDVICAKRENVEFRAFFSITDGAETGRSDGSRACSSSCPTRGRWDEPSGAIRSPRGAAFFVHPRPTAHRGAIFGRTRRR